MIHPWYDVTPGSKLQFNTIIQIPVRFERQV